MTYNVSALFDNPSHAAEAVRALQGHGFGERELTVITTPGENTDVVSEWEEDSVARGQRRTGGWMGGALGAAVGGYIGLVSMVLIPALPLLILGGAAAGTVAGRLMGLDLADHQVRDAESVLRAGGALLVVREDDAERAKLARDVLARCGVHAFSMDSVEAIPDTTSLPSDATAPSLGTVRHTWPAARVPEVDTHRELGELLTQPDEHIQSTSPQDTRHTSGALDLNCATETQIAEIDLLDKTLAHAIVALRCARGGLRSWDELTEIPGLDAKKISELQRAARLGPIPEQIAPPEDAIDLNHATELQLATLDFIGKKLAHKIVVWRMQREHGFEDWEDLREVPGIDVAKLAELKQVARLG
ncbi:MAG TPA: helix-hairpin-helix domain-containing protein [Polyangiaceae bacterium]|nr:helix-hairpin-helix domain-containing protein [Polyangiaceae bacterium]